MKHPLTSAERRGILTLGVLSLLITGFGIGVTYCDREPTVIEANDVEVLLRDDGRDSSHGEDSLSKAHSDSLRKVRRDSLRKVRRDSLRRKSKRAPRTYPRRSRLDEPV